MTTTKRSSQASTLLAQACSNVQGFFDMYRRFKRRMATSGRSTSTLNNYARHLSQNSFLKVCRAAAGAGKGNLRSDRLPDQ